MRNTANKERMVLALSCVLLGGLAGLSSGILSLFLELIEALFLNFSETASLPTAYHTPEIRRFLSVFIGGLIASLIWYLLRNKAKPLSSVTKALDGEQMPAKETAIHVFTQIFYVGTGGSVGRELAPREAGALIGQKWNNFLQRSGLAKLSQEDQQLLIAAAAGAGFAGVYIAPITGMLFAVEILLKKVSVRTVAVSLSMSIVAMLVGAIFKGFSPYYLISDSKFSLPILLIGLIIGPLCGILGAFFRKMVQWAEKNQTHSKAILWQLPLMALITGLIAMKFPEIMANGRPLAQLSMNGDKSLVLILFLGLILKALVTILTIRSGAAGGVLTPAIAVGAALGALIGLATGLSVVQCALLGAVALLGASQQAPLMAMFMLIEISHLDYSSFAPLGLAVALSAAVSQLILKKRAE